MKTGLLFLICFISTHTFAQKWCPPGAEWTIGWGGVWGYNGYNKISYEKDTIFMGKACKKLLGKGVNYDYINKVATNFDFVDPLYTYAQNDTVFIYYKDEFKAVYFFNAKVGDTLHFGNIEYCDDPPLVQFVDSIGTTIIMKDTLRFYRVQLLNLPWFMGDWSWTIIEKIGCIESDFYPSLMCAFDVDGYALCSYKDDDLNWHTSWSNDTCWYFTGTRDLFDQSLKITPNPAVNNLSILSSFKENIETISIIDIKGVLINQLKRNGGVSITEFSIETLQNGLYILQIETSNGNKYIRKFLKQSNY